MGKQVDKILQNKILQVENLAVTFKTYAGTIYAVNNISFSVKQNETLVIVGESGCGKSVTASSIMQYSKFNYATAKRSTYQD